MVQPAAQLPWQQTSPSPHSASSLHATQTLSVQTGVGLLHDPHAREPPQPSLIVPHVLPWTVQVVRKQSHGPQLTGLLQVCALLTVPHLPAQTVAVLCGLQAFFFFSWSTW